MKNNFIFAATQLTEMALSETEYSIKITGIEDIE